MSKRIIPRTKNPGGKSVAGQNKVGHQAEDSNQQEEYNLFPQQEKKTVSSSVMGVFGMGGDKSKKNQKGNAKQHSIADPTASMNDSNLINPLHTVHMDESETNQFMNNSQLNESQFEDIY